MARFGTQLSMLSLNDSIDQFWTRAKEKDPTVQWSDLRLWKMDLRGPYHFISFRRSDAGLFGMELTGDLMYLQIAGIFGWSSTPAAFQVITRAIQWELKHLLHSRILMYVEDIIGVCFAKDIVCDLAVTRNVCSRLLGSIAVADDKPETGTRVDILGYTVDLTTHSVIIAKKNFLNTIYGFLEVDLTAPISLTEAQRLAS